MSGGGAEAGENTHPGLSRSAVYSGDSPPTLDELHIGMDLDEDSIVYEADGTAVWWGVRHRCPTGTRCRDLAEAALSGSQGGSDV